MRPTTDYLYLKQFGAILLLLSFVTQAFTGAVIVGGYYVSPGNYAKNCVNRSRPQLHCNGRCQLLKKLKQEESRDQQSPVKLSRSEQVLSSRSFFVVIGAPTIHKQVLHPAIIIGDPIDRGAEFFHPPGA